MKCVIAGSRSVDQLRYVVNAIRKSRFDITEVVSGCAKGADTLGEIWATQNGIAVKKFPAQWDKLGKKAGPLRNIDMGNYADCAIIIWDGVSTGSKHMITVMKKLDKPYYIELVMDTTEVEREYILYKGF